MKTRKRKQVRATGSRKPARKAVPRSYGRQARPTAADPVGQRWYRSLFQIASNPIVVLDREGVVQMINQAGARNLGRPVADIVGRSLRDLLPEIYERAVPRYRRVIDRGVSLQFEDEVALPSGTRWFWSTLEPVRNAQGRVCAVQVISYDVTERKQAETALRQSEERLQYALRGANDGLWDWDLSSNHVYYSPRWKAILGYEDSEVEPQFAAFERLVAPEDRGRVKQQVAAVLAGEPVRYEVEFRMRHKAGHWVDILSRGELIRDERGRPVRMVGTHVDISPRKRVEQQLRELVELQERQARERAAALEASDTALQVHTERLRILQEGTADGLWDWNIITGEDYFSPRWTQILGYAPEELKNSISSFYTLLHPDDHAKVAAALEAHFNRQQPYEVEMRLRHKDGHYRWVLGRGHAVRDAAGQPVRMVGSATDITERKQVERRISALSDLGRKLNLATTHREAAQHVLEVARELLGWDACFVELYAPPQAAVVPVILMDTVEGQTQEVAFEVARERLGDGQECPPARAQLVVRDAAAVPSPAGQTPEQAARRPASLLFAPICSRDRIIGVFSIQSYTANAYSESALVTVETLADYCGGAFDRILAQTALQDSEARFAAFMNFLPASAYIKDAAGRHLFVNRHLVESIGLGAGQWLGRRLSELLPGPGGQVIEQNDQVLLANGKPRVYEEQLSERGNTRTYLSSKFPIRQADGATLLGGVSFEITEQRKAEQEREVLFQQVQAARLRLEQLSRRLLEVQESERRRIARELHDQIGQALTAIQIKLQTAAREAVSPPVRTMVTGCLGMLDELLQLTQNISLNLRPSMLDDLGLETALRWLSEQSVASGGPRGEFHPVPLEARLHPEIETACFRVAQEAVTNILRHSQALEFIVSLRREGNSLVLTVHDDGIGFDPRARFASPERYRDLGLLGMEERVALVGGRLEIQSAENAGTTVNAWFPLQWDLTELEGSLK